MKKMGKEEYFCFVSSPIFEEWKYSHNFVSPKKFSPIEVKKKKPKTNVPNWAEGIVVKPDTKWRNRQIGIYGTMSTVGVLLPPTIGKMLMVQLLIVIGQLIWRGVPTESGGYNLFGNSDGSGSHKKVAWVLGCSIFLTGKLLVFALMPSVLRGYKSTEIIGFVAENVLYMTANMFLQPCKGK
jgi:cytosine/uracil/thiamine/allantoin permease